MHCLLEKVLALKVMGHNMAVRMQVWLSGRASDREPKGPEFEPSPRKKKVFLLELLLIR